MRSRLLGPERRGSCDSCELAHVGTTRAMRLFPAYTSLALPGPSKAAGRDYDDERSATNHTEIFQLASSSPPIRKSASSLRCAAYRARPERCRDRLADKNREGEHRETDN